MAETTTMQQQTLFSDFTTQDSSAKCSIPQHCGIEIFKPFLDPVLAESLFEQLLNEIHWQQPSIQLAGKKIPIPRLQSWQGKAEYSYSYSGKQFHAIRFHPKIAELCNHINTRLDTDFNSVLCNLYRDGQDSVSWHADDEPELGPSPLIASLSLGETRVFQIKEKNIKSAPLIKIPLPHNSLAVMPRGFQSNYIHQIPKTKKIKNARINLTFRTIVTD